MALTRKRVLLIAAALGVCVSVWFALSGEDSPRTERVTSRAAIRERPAPSSSIKPPRATTVSLTRLLDLLRASRLSNDQTSALRLREEISTRLSSGERGAQEVLRRHRIVLARLDSETRSTDQLPDLGSIYFQDLGGYVQTGVERVADFVTDARATLWQLLARGPPVSGCCGGARVAHHPQCLGISLALTPILRAPSTVERDAVAALLSPWSQECPTIGGIIWMETRKRWPHAVVEFADSVLQSSTDHRLLIEAAQALVGAGRVEELISVLRARKEVVVRQVLLAIATGLEVDQAFALLNRIRREVTSDWPYSVVYQSAVGSSYAELYRRVRASGGRAAVIESMLVQLDGASRESGTRDARAVFNAATSAASRASLGSDDQQAPKKETLAPSVAELSQRVVKLYADNGSLSLDGFVALAYYGATPAMYRATATTVLNRASGPGSRLDVLMGMLVIVKRQAGAGALHPVVLLADALGDQIQTDGEVRLWIRVVAALGTAKLRPSVERVSARLRARADNGESALRVSISKLQKLAVDLKGSGRAR